jgi:putative ABC transport system substrate-binding protein
MNRRELITLVGGATAAWPLAARAQQALLPVIGFLHVTSLEATRPLLAEFHRGLGETGYVENKNVTIEYRWGQGHYDRMPTLIDELVSREVSVIVMIGSNAFVLAAKAATRTIPIVFMVGNDAAQSGLVDSLSKPGGNLTGISTLNVELAAKRLELLHQMVPAAKSVAYLRNPTGPKFPHGEAEVIQAAAQTLGVPLRFVDASDLREIEEGFANAAQHQEPLFVSSDSFFSFQGDRMVEFAARYSVPTIYNVPYAVENGGLVSYSTDYLDAWRQLGLYTGRILKGEKPATMPVELATKVNLYINLKTAKSLGLTVPLPLLGRADKVIE